MSVSVAQFENAFPEFADGRAPTILIQEMLDQATRFVSVDVWREQADDGIKYKAADLLANSPFGQEARLEPDSSTYAKTFAELRNGVVVGVTLGRRVRLT